MDAPQGLAYLRFESDIALEEERTVNFDICFLFNCRLLADNKFLQILLKKDF